MKIRAITLNNVRRFTDPACVTGIGNGLNVLCEPNEQGKSTLFDAIQALFFKPHGSRDKDVSALRPHAGGAPEVTIEIETDGGDFAISKRWFQKPAATVHRGGTLVAQSDAAEAWIADLLGGDAGGPSGLIWVRQGMTDLSGGSAREQKSALDARRDLMTSVGEEVENLTGGRRMDMALQRCRAALDELATGKSRAPRKGGPWKAAEDEVADLSARREALAKTADELHEALAERNRARRSLQQIEAADATDARRAKLEAAEKAHTTALRHAESLESAARQVEMARLTKEKAEGRLEALRAATEEVTTARDAKSKAQTEADHAQSTLSEREAELDTATRSLAEARQVLKNAEDAQRRARRAQAVREGAERREALQARIEAAEKARSDMENATAASRSGPDAKALRRIEDLLRERDKAIAARDATATRIIAHYVEGRDGAICLYDTPLSEGESVPLPRTVRLTLDGIGELEIRPAETGDGDASVDAAETALRQALDAVGAETPDAARDAAAARAEAVQRLKEAQAVYHSLAPDGIDALREALAAVPQMEEAEEAPDTDTAEKALDAAREAYDAAMAAQNTSTSRASDARIEAARLQTTLKSLEDRTARAKAALERLGDVAEDALLAESRKAGEALTAARAAHAELERDAPDLATTQATLNRARSVDQQARDEIARLKPLLAGLDERIGASSGKAVEEELAETEEKLQAAEDTLARIAQEVAVLTRLERALEDARNEARERYFAPIARELKPLLHLLWPEAELTWGEESLLPDALIRNGQEEPIAILSGGTQEQVALLVRLAFARMLAAAGRIAPVILDDALVFTDDDRIERMFDALHRQAGDLQIIVLTCRQRAFRDLGGNVLRLSAPAGAA